jgi:hypothetical protein
MLHYFELQVLLTDRTVIQSMTFVKMIKLSTNQKASLTEMPRSHWPILVRLE